MNKQVDLWSGQFGDEYHQRKQPPMYSRHMLFNHTISPLVHPVHSILEVGAGCGDNLVAIHNLNYGIRDLNGLEANTGAAMKMHHTGVCKKVYSGAWEDVDPGRTFGMVFTSGVLIHVHPDNRAMFMQKIIDHSTKYVVAIEYFSPELREIRYHGQDQALWVDDFGKLYMQMGLKLLDCKFYYKPLTGLDNVTCWVFEK